MDKPRLCAGDLNRDPHLGYADLFGQVVPRKPPLLICAAENIVEIRLWRDPPPAGSHMEYSIRHAGS